mmetsp:Transcript_38336/g.105759  ORF Transcript_38336/g.105759 Transcript_38336/m.105759 type:complete len:83 (+) Transcript_38336:117-365(+)
MLSRVAAVLCRRRAHHEALAWQMQQDGETPAWRGAGRSAAYEFEGGDLLVLLVLLVRSCSSCCSLVLALAGCFVCQRAAGER